MNQSNPCHDELFAVLDSSMMSGRCVVYLQSLLTDAYWVCSGDSLEEAMAALPTGPTSIAAVEPST